MKKYFVIGNPIDHSFSPMLHNYWFKKNNINASYDKRKINEDEIKSIIYDIKQNRIQGINVTVPFKNKVIPFLDELTSDAQYTQSLNTIYLDNGKTIGHNTDIAGFELSIKNSKYDISKKNNINFRIWRSCTFYNLFFKKNETR